VADMVEFAQRHSRRKFNFIYSTWTTLCESSRKKNITDNDHKIDSRWLLKHVSAAFSEVTNGNLVAGPKPQTMGSHHRISAVVKLGGKLRS